MAIFHSHFQKVFGVEKRFENRPRNAEPLFIIFHRERLPSAVRDDLSEPSVKFSIKSERSKFFKDSKSALLQQIHFEALMIESIDAVLVNPMADALFKQRFEFQQSRLQVREKPGYFGPII